MRNVGPLFVQNDLTVLLEVRHPRFQQTRKQLGRFAFLVKSPELLHTYKITPLSLWNAASSGLNGSEVIAFLQENCKFELPSSVRLKVLQWMDRYGKLELQFQAGRLLLKSAEAGLMDEIRSFSSIAGLLEEHLDSCTAALPITARGTIKQQLVRLGYPVLDKAGYQPGEFLPLCLRSEITKGVPFQLRPYQTEAMNAFFRNGDLLGGNGVIVLPCGAGKTIVGIAAMAKMKCATLILTTSATSVKQWKEEILEKTDLEEEMIGEYSGSVKQIRPVTIATYHILTHRAKGKEVFSHMHIFRDREWGLIIYDEVHLLPAPVFRITAELQAARRLGLTATLVREDGCEQDVFSLIGPKRFDLSWKELEEESWIAAAECTEVRIPLAGAALEKYRAATARMKQRIAGENPLKLQLIQNLIQRHKDQQILVIGQYLSQLRLISKELQAPIITGDVKQEEREELYRLFKEKQIRILVVSKVANFAVNLPDASVAIQVSGSFGSRQEEAQRLGRILRPKADRNKADFYSLVSMDTCEQEFALKRQLFLVEQGYQYHIENHGIEQMEMSSS